MIFFKRKVHKALWFFFKRKVHKALWFFRAKISQGYNRSQFLWFFSSKKFTSEKLWIFLSKKFTRVSLQGFRPCDFFRAKSSQGLKIFCERKAHQAWWFFLERKVHKRKVHKAIDLWFLSSEKFFRAKSSQGLMIFFERKIYKAIYNLTIFFLSEKFTLLIIAWWFLEQKVHKGKFVTFFRAKSSQGIMIFFWEKSLKAWCFFFKRRVHKALWFF